MNISNIGKGFFILQKKPQLYITNEYFATQNAVINSYKNAWENKNALNPAHPPPPPRRMLIGQPLSSRRILIDFPC